MSSIPIFIISMPDSKRVNVIKSQLARLGLSYEIQSAVIGKNLTDLQINNLVSLRGCDARLGYRISKNLIGSGLSHIEAYKKAYSLGSEWTLILEEDAILVELNTDLIYRATSILTSDPMIIQLFTRASRLIKSSTLQELEKNKFLFQFHRRIVGCGAPAYLINRKALKIALMYQKLDGAPDWPAWGRKVKFFGIYPWIFKETGNGSTIPTGSLSRIKYLRRRLSQLSGMHYLVYRSEYCNYKEYFLEEILPFLLYLLWRITGSKYFKNDKKGLQKII
jgi:GR25 family glycosyltransferase involved in LPS biosynthesis